VSRTDLRVLMVNRPDAESVPGGDTIQMRETRSALERLGVRSDLASTDAMPDPGGYDVIHVFNWEQLDVLLSPESRFPGNGPPIVLSTIFWHHTGHWFSNAVATRKTWRLISGCLGKRRACSLYESWQEAKLRRGRSGRRFRQNLSVPAQLLPNSQMEADHLCSVFGLRPISDDRVTVVPNGVKRELFDTPPAPDGAFMKEYGLEGFVLEVARIQSAKNQLGLIEALYDVPVPIVFVGQPSPYETGYVDRCRELAAARGNVHFIGTRNPQQLAGIFAVAGVHVLPSWRETPGLASLEAAAAGCRIVSTDIGSAREYFEDLAWYCDPRDPATIREAVTRALGSPRSDDLRQRILRNYTWEVAAEKTLAAYRRVLKAA
jgi:glycosyltransferase involved in cell wall biosynthesis